MKVPRTTLAVFIIFFVTFIGLAFADELSVETPLQSENIKIPSSNEAVTNELLNLKPSSDSSFSPLSNVSIPPGYINITSLPGSSNTGWYNPNDSGVPCCRGFGYIDSGYQTSSWPSFCGSNLIYCKAAVHPRGVLGRSVMVSNNYYCTYNLGSFYPPNSKILMFLGLSILESSGTNYYNSGVITSAYSNGQAVGG